LFLRLLSLQAPHAGATAEHGASAILGVLFVAVGAISILVSTVQHRRFVATLPLVDLPPSYNRGFAVFLSSAVGLLGFLLAAYLLVSGG
jgi:hypothetical protein